MHHTFCSESMSSTFIVPSPDRMKHCRRALAFLLSILAGCAKVQGNIGHDELTRIIGGLEAVEDCHSLSLLCCLDDRCRGIHVLKKFKRKMCYEPVSTDSNKQ